METEPENSPETPSEKNCLSKFTGDWVDHNGSLHAYPINQKEDGFAH